MAFGTLAALALKVGPMAIRGISSLFGGSEAADKVADIVEKTDKLLMPNQDKQALIENELEQLPPEVLVELKALEVELKKEDTRQKEIAAQDRQADHHETQTTVRSSDNADDPWVRRARPVIAIASFLASAIYVVGMALANAFGHGEGPDIATAGSLGSLAAVYMGVRYKEKAQGIAS